MKNKVKIIAEAGLNHNGNFKNVIKLIDIANDAKADYVKFQLFNTDQFINGNFKHKNLNYKKLFNRFKSLEFSLEKWKKAVKYAENKGIKIFFSIFDIESINYLEKLKIKIIKIPSGEINNFDLLKRVNKKKYRIILSTGMSNLKEIEKALSYLNNCDVILLHCVSEYPTLRPNLNNIKILEKKFKKKVGYSDHTTDTITPALSVMIGANYIEKHFTYDKNQKIGDHSFSLDPKELKEMVKNIRLAEMSLGLNKRLVSKKEKKLQFFARKGLYFKKNKFKGEKIEYSDLKILRPQGYLSVDKINYIKGKHLKKDVKSLSPIRISHLKMSK